MAPKRDQLAEVFDETPGEDLPDDDGEGDEGSDEELQAFLTSLGVGLPEGEEVSDEREAAHAINKLRLGVMLKAEQNREYREPAILRWEIEQLKATLESFAQILEDKGIATKQELRAAQTASFHKMGNAYVNEDFAGSGMTVIETDD